MNKTPQVFILRLIEDIQNYNSSRSLEVLYLLYPPIQSLRMLCSPKQTIRRRISNL